MSSNNSEEEVSEGEEEETTPSQIVSCTVEEFMERQEAQMQALIEKHEQLEKHLRQHAGENNALDPDTAEQPGWMGTRRISGGDLNPEQSEIGAVALPQRAVDICRLKSSLVPGNEEEEGSESILDVASGVPGWRGRRTEHLELNVEAPPRLAPRSEKPCVNYEERNLDLRLNRGGLLAGGTRATIGPRISGVKLSSGTEVQIQSSAGATTVTRNNEVLLSQGAEERRMFLGEIDELDAQGNFYGARPKVISNSRITTAAAKVDTRMMYDYNTNTVYEGFDFDSYMRNKQIQLRNRVTDKCLSDSEHSEINDMRPLHNLVLESRAVALGQNNVKAITNSRLLVSDNGDPSSLRENHLVLRGAHPSQTTTTISWAATFSPSSLNVMASEKPFLPSGFAPRISTLNPPSTHPLMSTSYLSSETHGTQSCEYLQSKASQPMYMPYTPCHHLVADSTVQDEQISTLNKSVQSSATRTVLIHSVVKSNSATAVKVNSASEIRSGEHRKNLNQEELIQLLLQTLKEAPENPSTITDNAVQEIASEKKEPAGKLRPESPNFPDRRMTSQVKLDLLHEQSRQWQPPRTFQKTGDNGSSNQQWNRRSDNRFQRVIRNDRRCYGCDQLGYVSRVGSGRSANASQGEQEEQERKPSEFSVYGEPRFRLCRRIVVPRDTLAASDGEKEKRKLKKIHLQDDVEKQPKSATPETSPPTESPSRFSAAKVVAQHQRDRDVHPPFVLAAPKASESESTGVIQNHLPISLVLEDMQIADVLLNKDDFVAVPIKHEQNNCEFARRFIQRTSPTRNHGNGPGYRQ